MDFICVNYEFGVSWIVKIVSRMIIMFVSIFWCEVSVY